MKWNQKNFEGQEGITLSMVFLKVEWKGMPHGTQHPMASQNLSIMYNN